MQEVSSFRLSPLRATCLLTLALGLSWSEMGVVLAQSPCTIPAAKRPSEVGCYFTAAESLGVLPPSQLFWHLYTYPSRGAAERSSSRGIVVQAFDKVWRFTIAPSDWRPSAGNRVAVIGPLLPTTADKPHVARYMEAVFLPGMRTRVHRHSGPEAWYVLAGAQCLETPEGIIVAKTGESALVRAGPPMVLSTVGRETRRAVLLVLHDASQPWSLSEEHWSARGACPT
jgi:quercetin dioxygenase-like cupin family protein